MKSHAQVAETRGHACSIAAKDARRREYRGVSLVLAALLAASGALASEYQGVIQTNGLPVPGATVTAIQGERKLATSTDEKGAFNFRGLADGKWTFQVEMLGFAVIVREVDVKAGLEAAKWDLKLLTQQALLARLNPDAAPVERTTARRTFQRMDVSQSTETSTFASEGALKSEDAATLNQSAANSFLVQGSVSSAIGLGQQNDWGMGGPGGPMGMTGPMGMGGPGGQGLGGSNGDGPGSNTQVASMRMMGGGGAPVGRDGMGGGPGGGGPPPGGGGPPAGGGGGMGGPGGGGPGGGGPGGFGGGPGGRPPWEGRPGAMAFGNNRRDPRNLYMGSAFFSLDNSALDARSFSVTGADIAKPASANFRAGIQFGGPLQIPKLVSRSRRIQFSLDVQLSRNRQGNVSNAVTVPTALERAGDFSQSVVSGSSVVIYDPTTGAPFANDKIPTSRISSTAAGLLKYYPLPNLTSSTLNYEIGLTGHTNQHNINGRLSNIKLGSNDRLNFGLGYQGGDSSTPNIFNFLDTGSSRGMNVSLGWSHNFTTKLIDTVQLGFSRNRQQSSPYFSNRENVAAELGILGTSQASANWGPPSINLTNYAGLSDGSASLNRSQTFNIGNNLLWVHGAHTFTFGGDYRRQQFNQYSDSNGRGTYTFDGSATSLLSNGTAVTGTGYDLADLLLGVPTTSSIRYGNPDKYFRGRGFDALVNDDWRLTTRFSINWGLRWDYATPVSELYNRLINLAISPGYASITPVVATSSNSTLVNPDYNNFSPRVGLAWRPSTSRSLVIRSGYGVYYNTSVYNLIAANMAQQPPFAEVLSVAGSAANRLNISNAFLSASTNATSSTYAIDPNYRVGYAQTWNVQIQSQLPFSLFGTVGYLGTKGTRLDQQFIPNSVAPGAVESSLPHSYIYETSNGNSIYNALQTQLNRRFHNGIMWRASYNFSKSIDDAGTGGRGQGGTPVAENWLNLLAERALSSFDSRHNLSVGFQYSSGMGVAGGTLLNGWKGALLKDWTFGGDLTLRSGTPFTATVGGNRSQVSGTAVSNTVRAQATGLPIEVDGALFNTNAFTTPASGTWGNAGRNTIPGPTMFSLNSSFGRIFRFGERRSIDLQLQGQNILNHVTITSWGTVLGAANFGLATNAGAMRKITLNLRFRF